MDVPYFKFLIEAVLISLTGVMAPGPMTTVTVGKGAETPHAGAFIAIGHGIFEYPLMILIFFGFGTFLKEPHVKNLIGIIGGLFLLLMGFGMFRSFIKAGPNYRIKNKYNRSPVISGILLSAGNPYFLLWWATVGTTLLLRSAEYGIYGFIVFSIVHWSCDLVWFSFLSILSFNGSRLLGNKFQKGIFLICGIMLIFFSGKFIFNGLKVYF